MPRNNRQTLIHAQKRLNVDEIKTYLDEEPTPSLDQLRKNNKLQKKLENKICDVQERLRRSRDNCYRYFRRRRKLSERI